MDFRPRTPRYLQIAEALRHDLRGEGERIASEHQLCARFDVSRPTIRQALDVLVQEGRLYRHAGRGTFSTPTAGTDRRLRVIGSLGDMIALGDETWFKLITREIVRVPANIAQALRLTPGATGYRIVGVRHGENGPFQHVTTYLPTPIGKALEHEDLSKTAIFAAIERHLGLTAKSMEQVTDAALAPRQVSELLQIRPRSPVLMFERTYFTASGEALEHAVSYHATLRYPYRVSFSRHERPERRSS